MRITACLPRAFLAVMVVLMLILSGPAQSVAQQLPGPTLDMESVDLEDLSVNFDDSFNAIDSPYLSGAMLLNYQINLLEKMNARQAELLKISDSFAAMGLPFEEPAPARGLCEQLPPNAPCLKHYPELYKVLVDSRKAFYEDQRAKMAQASGVIVDPEDPAAVERARKAKEEQERRLAEAKAKAAAIERATRYEWTDIKCAMGICTGVIIRPKEAGYRATVQKGARLGDGTLITDIHLHGIHAVVDGDKVEMRPAPSDTNGTDSQNGSAASADAAGDGAPDAIIIPNNAGVAGSSSSTSQVLERQLNQSGASGPAGNVATANNNASTAQIPDPVAPSGDNGGMSTVQPTLGPSGLF